MLWPVSWGHITSPLFIPTQAHSQTFSSVSEKTSDFDSYARILSKEL